MKPRDDLERRRAFMKTLIVKLKEKEAILKEFCLTQSCSRRLAVETYNIVK